MKRALLFLVLAAACGTGTDLAQVPGPQPDPQAPQPQKPGPDRQQQPLTGLPCDVHAVLQASCAECHAKAVYFYGFTTRSHLLDLVEPGKTLGQKAAERLRDPDVPMPPKSATHQPTAAERDLVVRWIEAGMPAGECGELQ